MDKSCNHSSSSSGDRSSPNPNPNPNADTNPKDHHFLRHLNKLSHKISKPSTSTSAVNLRLPPPPPPPHHQPPVYNINKTDFRHVVQQLTGSPSHSHHAPPPTHAPNKPATSRLHRIRPPPLIQLTPPILNPTASAAAAAPFSPLPPLPTCHAAAESPISAYMRFLRTSSVDSGQNFSNRMIPPPSALDSFSLPSPKSPCQPLSPNLLLSPTGAGPLGVPQSSGVPSPKWRDL